MYNFRIIHHVDQKTINEMYYFYSPVFILSTGRAGSKFMALLLDQSQNISAFHEPQPTLQYFSNYAYHNQNEEVLSKIINAARMEMILEIFIKNRIYVESNQCLTFFSPVIANLFKKSKFVHLIRHPGHFVRSAFRKGWHKNDSIWESGRVKIEDKDQWQKMNQIEKLGWVWQVTNQYIEKFKNQIGTQRFFTCKLEELTEKKEIINELLHFVGASDFQWEKIIELQKNGVNEFRIGPNEPPNMKKSSEFPEYEKWNKKMKTQLKNLVKDLAYFYDYKL